MDREYEILKAENIVMREALDSVINELAEIREMNVVLGEALFPVVGALPIAGGALEKVRKYA